MADMVSSVGAALVEGMIANMDPSRQIVVQQLQAFARGAQMDNELKKSTILNGLYEQLEKQASMESKNVDIINSLNRRIKILEEI